MSFLDDFDISGSEDDFLLGFVMGGGSFIAVIVLIIYFGFFH